MLHKFNICGQLTFL